MDAIEPPDIHHLNAARGWLELGNAEESWLELEEILPRWNEHPDVLNLLWDLYAAEKAWPKALATARQMVTRYPDSVAGWIHQSYALHEMKQTMEARDALSKAVGRFPKEGTIPYNLACYECQLGEINTAKRWLALVEKVLGKEVLKEMATDDDDLQPLWDYVKSL
ncbi:MAG TPA: tetratricopeptide repeat protein [Verrucomicrobiae bacterium]